MTNKEFSDSFDTLVNSYQNVEKTGETISIPAFDEYEKSLFLTKAQETVIISYYSGKNPSYEGFEASEEFRRYLNTLVTTKEYDITEAVEGIKLDDNSVFFTLPSESIFITLEQITFDDTNGCYKGKHAGVHPIAQDEWENIKDNPFRGPTRYKAIRIDTGDKKLEIVSKYPFSKYLIKYLRKPNPIILTDLPDGLTIDGKSEETECELNPLLHNLILQTAVDLALLSRNHNKSS